MSNIYDAPLYPEYTFNDFCLAGETPIFEKVSYDWWIDRPKGMNGWIINLTVDGVGQIWDDENTFLVNKGDIVIFPESVPHLYGRYPKSKNWVHRWIYFHQLPEWESLLKFSHSINGVYLLNIKTPNSFEKINSLFEETMYLSYMHKLSALSTQLFLNLTEEILIRCRLIELQNQENQNVEITDEDLPPILQWLSLNYHKKLSIKEIAQTFNMSAQNLCKKFKKQMNTPILQWINNHRLNMASKLLLISETSVKKVALQVGFTDSLYFSKLFKKKYGCAPTKYRENI